MKEQRIQTLAHLAEKMVSESVISIFEKSDDGTSKILGYKALLNDLEDEINDSILNQLQLGVVGEGNPRAVLVNAQLTQDFRCVGDCAVSIALLGKELSALRPVEGIPGVALLADMTMQMLSNAVSSFVEIEGERARSVPSLLAGHGQYSEDVVRNLVNFMLSRPQFMEQTLCLIRVCRNLERVAELAVAIAEKVIFMSEVPAWKQTQRSRRGLLVHDINAESVGGK